MTSNAEYESTLREAERELGSAATAEDVRRIWRKHVGVLGHRSLGRLLAGRSADDLAARRASRSQGD